MIVRLAILAVLAIILLRIGRNLASWLFLRQGQKILTQNLAREKDHTRALYWLKLAQESDPTNPSLYLYLGLYHTKSNDPTAARAAFTTFGELADQDLGYFFRVLHSLPPIDGVPANGSQADSQRVRSLPPIDPTTAQVSPSTALFFAWIGMAARDATLTRKAFDRAESLEGHSFLYHAARGAQELLGGKISAGRDQLERALILREAQPTPCPTGIGFFPFSIRLDLEQEQIVPKRGPWIGQIVTHPESVNLATAQLLSSLCVLAQQRKEYQRSIGWAELARKRFPAELTKLGLTSQVERHEYPLNFWPIVSVAASKYNLDPLLILALTREESHFNPQAVSPAGARGLMQLMPKTASWIAAQLRWSGFSEEVLANPQDNIEFGSYYVQYLQKTLGTNPEALPWVLAAYNGGIGNVKRWMEMKVSGTDPDAPTIEFKETRDYLRKVLRSYDSYRRIYKTLPALAPETSRIRREVAAAGVDTPSTGPAGAKRKNVKRPKTQGRHAQKGGRH